MSREATAGLRSIFGRIALSQTALRSQRNKDWKNNSLFASPSICCPTLYVYSSFHQTMNSKVRVIPSATKTKFVKDIFAQPIPHTFLWIKHVDKA